MSFGWDACCPCTNSRRKTYARMKIYALACARTPKCTHVTSNTATSAAEQHTKHLHIFWCSKKKTTTQIKKSVLVIMCCNFGFISAPLFIFCSHFLHELLAFHYKLLFSLFTSTFANIFHFSLSRWPSRACNISFSLHSLPLQTSHFCHLF